MAGGARVTHDLLNESPFMHILQISMDVYAAAGRLLDQHEAAGIELPSAAPLREACNEFRRWFEEGED